MSRIAPFAVLCLFALGPNAAPVNAELATSFQQTGNLGIEVVAAAGGNNLITSGTLTLNDLPPTATIVRATLYASQMNNPVGQEARFGGTDLGTIGPYASDSGPLEFFCYRWDVTALVTAGTNAYTYRVGGHPNGGPVAGVALLVVWHDWTEPTRLITINDGVVEVSPEGESSQMTTFDNIGDGETSVWMFTVLDDATNTGETIEYNSAVIGGPIDQNLGPLASLIEIETNSINGTNNLNVSTGFDSMGWLIAATAVVAPTVPVSTTTWSEVKGLYQ